MSLLSYSITVIDIMTISKGHNENRHLPRVCTCCCTVSKKRPSESESQARATHFEYKCGSLLLLHEYSIETISSKGAGTMNKFFSSVVFVLVAASVTDHCVADKPAHHEVRRT